MASKRKHISLYDKLEIIEEFERNPQRKKVDLAKEFKIPESTLKGILSKKHDIQVAAGQFGAEIKKRSKIQSGRYAELERVLMTWFNEMRASNSIIKGAVLKEKASEIAEELKIENFNASCGWLDKLKKRHGLSHCFVYGERSLHSETEDWKNKLPKLCEGYQLKDIFSASETELFFCSLSDKAIGFRNEKSHGNKHFKERLTLLLTCNADGSENSIMIIEKSDYPRWFKNARQRRRYEISGKTCLTCMMFKKRLRKLDSKMKKEKRKILLFIDGCLAHRNLPDLQNVKLVFFPKNCSSVLRPLDQGIIRCVKIKYHMLLVKKLILQNENNLPAKKISFSDAIDIVHSACHKVPKTMILNCFEKAGLRYYTNSFSDSYTSETSDESEESEYEITVECGLIPNNQSSFEEFVNADMDGSTYELRDGTQIIEEVGNSTEDTCDSSESDSSEFLAPSFIDAVQSLSTLRRYITSCQGDLHTQLNEIENEILKTKPGLKPGYDWYQSESHVCITVLIKNVKSENVRVDVVNNVLTFTAKIENETRELILNLAHEVQPNKFTVKVLSCKVEIKLKKIEVFHWSSLTDDKSKSTNGVKNVYPSSLPQKKDWDKIALDIKKEEESEKLEGEAALNDMFQKIYADGSEETKMAMNKSFLESGGTVLSTNWKDVGEKKVAVHPPDGVEWKTWN